MDDQNLYDEFGNYIGPQLENVLKYIYFYLFIYCFRRRRTTSSSRTWTATTKTCWTRRKCTKRSNNSSQRRRNRLLLNTESCFMRISSITRSRRKFTLTLKLGSRRRTPRTFRRRLFKLWRIRSLIWWRRTFHKPLSSSSSCLKWWPDLSWLEMYLI